jgi:hypothetical protein
MKWCTYSWYGKDCPQYIGQAYNIEKTHCFISYKDNQLYSREAWDTSYVKFFDTLEDAIYFMIKKSNLSLLEIKEQVLDKFNDSKYVNWEIFNRSEKIEKIKKLTN